MYSCKDIVRWVSSEKHFSNEKKEALFNLFADSNCTATHQRTLSLSNVAYGVGSSGKKVFFKKPTNRECSKRDQNVVILLSNYSINNNFSHFLHALLRLFCALIDAGYIVWDVATQSFVIKVRYTLWLDEYFKINPKKWELLKALAPDIRLLANDVGKGQCIVASSLLYGSGCVRLLPPEKWLGYPHCRSKEMSPAFGHFMRQRFNISNLPELVYTGKSGAPASAVASVSSSPLLVRNQLQVVFAIRESGNQTGRRDILNLGALQTAMLQAGRNVPMSIKNVTFERLSMVETAGILSRTHVFVSVHGAGLTNMFFMKHHHHHFNSKTNYSGGGGLGGGAVVELLPYPLCGCESRDYFFGEAGYYHGSALAQQLRHYSICIDQQHTHLHHHQQQQDQHSPSINSKGDGNSNSKSLGDCSWRQLHSVRAVSVDLAQATLVTKRLLRELVADSLLLLATPTIHMGIHVNG